VSPLDPQLLDELARCFMRAALDEYLRELAAERHDEPDESPDDPTEERDEH
jgi:hypothetical protein